jgi:ABC-type glutathione transport system ATPase component
VKDVSKSYVRKRWPGVKIYIKALDSVSFSLKENSSIAFVGESGSGKTTLGMCVSRLIEPDSGKIILNGVDLLSLSGDALRQARSKIQMVFQDAATAFNPGFTAEEVITEPMVIQSRLSRTESKERAAHLMELVGLSPDSLHRSPMQFSGGQRQRLAIARALAADAHVLILDEALSGLDMSVQAEIVNLLIRIKSEKNLTYIFISHDIELARYLADEIAVMEAGRIVEMGRSTTLLTSAKHPRTQALVGATLTYEMQS